MSEFVVKATVPHTDIAIMVTAPTETSNRYRVVRTAGNVIDMDGKNTGRFVAPFVMWDYSTEADAREGANYLWSHAVSERNRVAPWLTPVTN